MMQKDIEILLKVQEEDVKIFSLKKDSLLLPEQLQSIKDEVQSIEKRLKDKHDEIQKLQVARKDMEIELETKQGDIRKFQTQLFQLKTNEEYKAMQNQINDVKFTCGLTEDKILEKMEEIEKAQKELKGIEDVLAGARKTLAEKEKEISAKIEGINSEIVVVQKVRDELAKGADVDLLKKYELIFKNKHGAAIVSVDNKTCQGCHMALPPNVINDVKRGAEFVICDNCARILYFPN